MRRRGTAAAAAALMLSWTMADGPPVAAQEAEGESSRVEAGEAVATERTVIGDGHIDIGPRFLDGDWTLLVRDDTVEPSAWRRLPDVVLQATDEAVVEVPDDPEFAFLGEPGARVWLLPQVQQQGILWPGWNTQDPEVATTVDREVTWTLHDVEGPGDVVLFVNQDFGTPETLFDSREPYPQETGIEVNTHAHANWVFTEPGVYRLAMAMSATTADGEEVAGGGTLRVAVADATDPEEAFAAAELAVPGGADDGGEGTGDAGSAARAGEAEDGGSSSATPWVAAGGAVVLVVLGAAVTPWARARRRTGRAETATGTAGGAGGGGDSGGPGGLPGSGDAGAAAGGRADPGEPGGSTPAGAEPGGEP